MDNPELDKLAAKARADEAEGKIWLERYLNWIIAALCFVAGAILGHLWR